MTKNEALKLALEALEVATTPLAKDRQEVLRARAAIREALAQPETVSPGGGLVPAVPVAVYGYCPVCGGAGVMRERRPNGDDKCTNGHKYPSSKALAQPEQEPVAWADECRIELVTAIHFLASDYENALGVFRDDAEARRKAEGDIAHARKVASRWNWNGTTPPQRKPLTDEEIWTLHDGYLNPVDFARAIEAAHGIWPENSDCYGPDWTDRDGEYLK